MTSTATVMPSATQLPVADANRIRSIRHRSEELIAGLEPEDLCLQGMADASPAKWHLGHTSWFFEEFLLSGCGGYRPADARWRYLFNSYYEAVGARHPRPQRGLLTRPTIAEVLRWRDEVSTALEEHHTHLNPQLLELGLQHEQQHQELLLMDLLDGFSRNPLEPVAQPNSALETAHAQAAGCEAPLEWISHEGGLVEIGHQGAGFHFDNETPRHRQWLVGAISAPSCG